MKNSNVIRKLPIGAEIQSNGEVHFRVWAPQCKRVELMIEGSHNDQSNFKPIAIELQREEDGYFCLLTSKAAVGTRYRYRLDGNDYLYPDPATRFQPEGPHGPSVVIDPSTFRWTDQKWRGAGIRGQVIYEMHIGTFTSEGNWQAASKQLAELADLGITVIEVMPIAEFPGRFGWGYDGVNLFAPTRIYGQPDDLRDFVNKAHAVGIGVILDVVYNHLGPDGNYLKPFAADYFSKTYDTEWGEALNFDGENSGPVREYFLANVKYWLSEFHIDGLRLDATQQIFDNSKQHILADITRAVRDAAQGRDTMIVAENETQHVKLVKPLAEGGYGIDALWNDDFHHSAMVALTGHKEAYYTDHLGKPQEFISAVKYGYLFQGQRYKWQKQRRGTAAIGLKPEAFVTFIQNHDQVANSGRGLRAHALTTLGRFKAITALMLLAPGTPMLFQGQEFAASNPFFYFADHTEELAKLVSNGRVEFLHQFSSLARPEMQKCFTDPADIKTFERCKLDFSERERNKEIYTLHRDLLKLRREDPVFRRQQLNGVDGAVLASEAFLLRFFGDNHDDRLVLINFGVDLHLDPAPEPLLAPPEDMRWQVLWSSENPLYGGCGTPDPDSEVNWRLPGHSALVLSPIVFIPEPEAAKELSKSSKSVEEKH